MMPLAVLTVELCSRIFLPLAQGASSSASGIRVVLPAPGGATSTAALCTSSVRDRSSSTASIGRGVSKLRGKISLSSSPALRACAPGRVIQ